MASNATSSNPHVGVYLFAKKIFQLCDGTLGKSMDFLHDHYPMENSPMNKALTQELQQKITTHLQSINEIIEEGENGIDSIIRHRLFDGNPSHIENQIARKNEVTFADILLLIILGAFMFIILYFSVLSQLPPNGEILMDTELSFILTVISFIGLLIIICKIITILEPKSSKSGQSLQADTFSDLREQLSNIIYKCKELKVNYDEITRPLADCIKEGEKDKFIYTKISCNHMINVILLVNKSGILISRIKSEAANSQLSTRSYIVTNNPNFVFL